MNDQTVRSDSGRKRRPSIDRRLREWRTQFLGNYFRMKCRNNSKFLAFYDDEQKRKKKKERKKFPSIKLIEISGNQNSIAFLLLSIWSVPFIFVIIIVCFWGIQSLIYSNDKTQLIIINALKFRPWNTRFFSFFRMKQWIQSRMHENIQISE